MAEGALDIHTKTPCSMPSSSSSSASRLEGSNNEECHWKATICLHTAMEQLLKHASCVPPFLILRNRNVQNNMEVSHCLTVLYGVAGPAWSFPDTCLFSMMISISHCLQMLAAFCSSSLNKSSGCCTQLVLKKGCMEIMKPCSNCLCLHAVLCRAWSSCCCATRTGRPRCPSRRACCPWLSCSEAP